MLNIESTDVPTLKDFQLPVGLEENNYTISFVLKILNEYGQYAEYKSLSVQVGLFLRI